MKVLSDFFLEEGYIVAAIKYRVCPDVTWPTPVEDIAQGINAIFNLLNEKKFNVNETIYVGFSAGSIAGALILYSGKYVSAP